MRGKRVFLQFYLSFI